MMTGILEQVLLYLPLMLGLMLSFRILRLTDLTVDGSFVLGAATCARLLVAGCPVSMAIACSMLVGGLTGCMVGLLQANQRMNSLMAGILALFILYSVNFQVMGKPNISLLDTPTVFSVLLRFHLSPLEVLILGNLFLMGILYFILQTRFGLLLRALGDNPRGLAAMGFSVNRIRCLGLMLSNALAAYCGAMVAQLNGFADLHMGIGIALIGIGAVVIGTEIAKRMKFFSVNLQDLSSGLMGALVYFSLMSVLLKFGVDPIQVKLVMGVLLVFVLGQRTGNRSKRISS